MSVPCCLHEWLIMHGVVSIVYLVCVFVSFFVTPFHCMLQPRPSSFQDQAGSFCTRYRQGLISPLFFFGGVGISLFAWLILRYLTPKFTGSLHLIVNSVENATAVHAFYWHLKTGRKIDKSNTYNSWYWKFHFEIGKICLWWYVPHFKKKSIYIHL